MHLDCLSYFFTGGLAFSSYDIGMCLALMGAFYLLLQLVAYPFLSRFFSVVQLYRAGTLLYTVIFIGMPLLCEFAKSSESPMHWIMWLILGFLLLLRQLGEVLVFTSVTIMIRNSAVKESLGIVNGVAQTSAAFARSIGMYMHCPLSLFPTLLYYQQS